MSVTRLVFFLIFIIASTDVSFAQYDDDDDYERKKRSRRVRIFSPNPQKSNRVRQKQRRNESSRRESQRLSQETDRQRSRAVKKRHKTQNQRYYQNRGELQNRATEKRMRKSERMSRKINDNKTMPFVRRVAYRLRPNRHAATHRRANELRKREDIARNRYESTYTPTSQRRQKNKLRQFNNPFKRENRRR